MRWLFLVVLSAVLMAQQFPDLPKDEDSFDRLPNGKSQSEAIIKSDHEKSLKDLDEMKKLIESVYEDVEKNTQHVVSVQTLKKLSDIEKKARNIRNRMTRN